MDPTTIVSDVKTTDVLPGLTFIGGVDPDFLQDDSDFLQEIGLSAATAAVYTKSGTTIAGTATQTSLVVTGNSNNISSPAPGAKIVVSGSNNTVQASGAGANLIVSGQNNHLFGSGGGDQFLGTGTGNETGNGLHNKFVLSTSPGSTSGMTVANFHSGSDHIDVIVTPTASLQSLDLIPISPSQFGIGPAATTPAQRFVYNQAAGTLFFDPDGSGPAQPTLIGHFTPGTAMGAGDILVTGLSVSTT